MFELNDSRIIQRHNDLAVMAQRFEVMFRDGTSVRLHPVAVQGHEQPLLRALQLQGDHWAVIDLRHFGPELEADLRRLQPRDAPGVVKIVQLYEHQSEEHVHQLNVV